MTENLVELSVPDCLARLNLTTMGRLCVVEDGYPVAFPVNYRLVAGPGGDPRVVMRTGPDSVMHQPGNLVSLEIDGSDPLSDTGWSVICRGVLHDAEPTDEWLTGQDPHPWIEDRNQWQYIVPSLITGRRVAQPEVTWALSVRGYL